MCEPRKHENTKRESGSSSEFVPSCLRDGSLSRWRLEGSALTLALAGLLVASGHSQPLSAQTMPSPTPPGTVSASVSPRAVAIGAIATLEVSATFPSSPRWVEIDLGPLSSVFEVRRVKSGRTFGARRRWTIEITAFEPGPVTIAPLTINGALDTGPSGPLATTAAIDVDITSPAVSASDPLRPLAGRLDPPPLPVWVRIAVSVSGAAIALALVVVSARSLRRFLRRRRVRREFWRGTLAELRELSERAQRTSGEERRPVLHAAATVIKTALAAAFDRRLRGRTSADVHAILSEQPKHQKVRDRSAAIFDSLDRQRFGPQRTAKPDESPLPDAVALVERLPKRLRSEEGR